MPYLFSVTIQGVTMVVFKIPGRIFNKTVWLVLETQTRNSCVIQETTRTAIWYGLVFDTFGTN